MRLTTGFIGLFLLACGSKPPVNNPSDSGGEGNDTGASEDSGVPSGDTGKGETGDTEEPLVPEQGNYAGNFTEVVADECGYGIEADESVDLWWTLDGTTLAFVGIEDQYDVIEAPCTFEDNAFSCTIFENVTEAEDLDARVTFLASMNGEWRDTTSIQGAYDVSLECVGADCAQYIEEAFGGQAIPCTTSVAFRAKWTEEELEIPVTPEEGKYTADFGTVSLDECGLTDQGYQEALDGYALHFDLSSRLMVDLDNEGTIVATETCTRTGPSFTCPLQESIQASKDYDATIALTLDLEGEWVAPTKIAGDMDYSFTCTGSECSAYVKSLQLDFPVPCTTAAPFSGAKQ